MSSTTMATPRLATIRRVAGSAGVTARQLNSKAPGFADDFAITREECNGAGAGGAGKCGKFADQARNDACLFPGVFLKLATRTALILIPLTTSAARLHAHAVQTPLGVTQEVNRCLFIVRTATSRRGAQNKFAGATRVVAPATQSTSVSARSL
jgi:hypothetical protein